MPTYTPTPLVGTGSYVPTVDPNNVRRVRYGDHPQYDGKTAYGQLVYAPMVGTPIPSVGAFTPSS